MVYYDSRDLTTHAVVVGMTGSGKTGLCITLLEEAVLDNIPAIIIDPKGDITNLLLTFPTCKPEDFEPWVNVDDARRAGLEVRRICRRYRPEVARRPGELGHRAGARRHLQAERPLQHLHARLRRRPADQHSGRDAARRDGGWQPGDDEVPPRAISGIVTALLALIGKNVEPVKDREHVLIANIFEHAWRRGQDLTLEDVILQVQKPPFSKLGVFDIDTFFPEKERFSLAMELNNIIASPSFQSWIQGEPLDIQSLLYTPEGKPRVSIFYIAHLTDAERMFIVTLLLENMLAWMRTLSGTTSLRALLYFDEMFGFFPPHPYNPPSKDPMLRLLKQARAFGLGLVLATQNPATSTIRACPMPGRGSSASCKPKTTKTRLLNGLEALESAGGRRGHRRHRPAAEQHRPARVRDAQRSRQRRRDPDAYPLGDELPARPADPPADQASLMADQRQRPTIHLSSWRAGRRNSAVPAGDCIARRDSTPRQGTANSARGHTAAHDAAGDARRAGHACPRRRCPTLARRLSGQRAAPPPSLPGEYTQPTNAYSTQPVTNHALPAAPAGRCGICPKGSHSASRRCRPPRRSISFRRTCPFERAAAIGSSVPGCAWRH